MTNFKSLLPVLGATLLAAQLGLAQSDQMSFFITSAGPGDGANLGGLKGADAHCQKLAKAAGSKKKGWKAYLSQAPEGKMKAVNAKDRIGKGPWYNSKGVKVADSIDNLHSENMGLGKDGSLTEKGDKVNGRGDKPNTHDILTGSNADGTLASGAAKEVTCNNWTSNTEGSAWVGHHDRQGGGTRPNSWNSAHQSKGCSQPNLVATGGAGLFYCFAPK